MLQKGQNSSRVSVKMRPLSASSALRGPPLTLCDVIQRGYLSHVSVLVNLGIRLETRDSSGRTPLMLTAYVQPEEWGVGVARLLIEEGIRMTSRDRQGMTALHHACIYERLQLVQVLLNAPDFDLTQQDRFGNTSLHYAAMSGNAALVRLLASHFQKYRLPFDTLNKHLYTAKGEALRRDHTDCADILAELTPAPVHPKDANIIPQDNKSIIVVLSEDNSSLASDSTKQLDTLQIPSTSGLRRARSANWSGRSENRCLQRPSLPVISVNAWKSGDSVQKVFVPNFGDNKQSEDASVASEKNGERKMSEISMLEKPPVHSNDQRRKSSTVLRERTNHLSNVQAVQYGSNTSIHKHFPSQQSRRNTIMSTSSQMLLPYDKDPEKIIHLASEHDFRNTREFVLKVTHMAQTPVPFDTECMPGMLPPTMAVQNDNQNCTKLERGGSWRDAMRFLYNRYEYQWSPSWRRPAQPPPDPAFLSPGTGEEKEELKDRKHRRSGSQVSELSCNSLTRLRKLNAAKRRISNCGLPPAVSRATAPDPGRDHEVTSPDTGSSGTSSPPTRKKQEVKGGQGSLNEGTSRQGSPKPPADSTRNTPSPDNGRTFITHNQSNHSDDISAGNGNAAMTGRDWNFRLGTSSTYTVPAVMECLVVDGETDAQESNAEPTAIDTNKLYVFSDVDDEDDDD